MLTGNVRYTDFVILMICSGVFLPVCPSFLCSFFPPVFFLTGLEQSIPSGFWRWLHWVTTSLTFHFHALEEEMAAHSSGLAGESQTAGPGVLPSMGVAQSRTRLKWLSSSSSSITEWSFSYVIFWCDVSYNTVLNSKLSLHSQYKTHLVKFLFLLRFTGFFNLPKIKDKGNWLGL